MTENEQIKVTDYVAAFLANKGVKHTFGLTGGAVVHIFDSIALQEGIETIFPHHEQSAALAAATYARCNGMGVCISTTGPGSTNTLTGLLGAWQDSIPCIFISGNARRNQMSHNRPMRQIGTQEFDIVAVTKNMTKYAAVVEEPEKIRDVMETAWHEATTGRPGPVWIDIPIDVQWSMITADPPPHSIESSSPEPLKAKTEDIEKVAELLKGAKRPLILAGNGARLAHAEHLVRKVVEDLSIPVIGSWTGSDIFPSDHDLYAGIPGISGQRGGNLAIQNTDLLICLGSHLNVPITGGNYDAFAREADVVMVNIDPVELETYTVHVEHPIHADLAEFCQSLLNTIRTDDLPDITPWREKCKRYRQANDVPQDRHERTDYADPYVFMAKISDRLLEEPLVVDGGGTSLYASFQALKTHEGQRILCPSAISAMGTGLPDAIGAAFATGKRVLCTIGDGSMQLNIQELQTIVTHKLPIKIAILNNSGYLAIRHTQSGFLDKRFVGSSEEGGITIPSYEKLAHAYGLPYCAIRNNQEMSAILDEFLSNDEPGICELFISPDETPLFSQGFRDKGDGTFEPLPLEDMSPLLSREEFHELMEIKEWKSTSG
jgi:acetolactate synthase-1/2/3 large subunit